MNAFYASLLRCMRLHGGSKSIAFLPDAPLSNRSLYARSFGKCLSQLVCLSSERVIDCSFKFGYLLKAPGWHVMLFDIVPDRFDRR